MTRTFGCFTICCALLLGEACRSAQPAHRTIAALPDSALRPGTGAIVGAILDSHSGKPVLGGGVALISTEDLGARHAVFLSGGASGRFAIVRIPPSGAYRIHCVASGRPSVDIFPVRVMPDLVDSLTCRLSAPVHGPVLPPPSDTLAFAVQVSDVGVRITMPMPHRDKWPLAIPDTVTVSHQAYGWFANWTDHDGVSCQVPSVQDARRTESLPSIVQTCRGERYFLGEWRYRPMQFTQPDPSLVAVVSHHNVEFRFARDTVWRLLVAQRPDSMRLGVVLSALEATYVRTVRIAYSVGANR